MTYPVLINGALINGDGQATTEGIELVFVAPHTAYGVLALGGVHAFEMGNHRAGIALPIEGLEMATHGAPQAVSHMKLSPQGIDMASHGAPVFVGTIVAVGAFALELGDHRVQLGRDVAATPVGIEMAHVGFHDVLSASPPSNITLAAAGSRPFQLGTPAVMSGPISITAGGMLALEMGQPSVGVGLLAVGAVGVMELGTPSVGTTLQARSAWPMEFGRPAIGVALTVQGIDLGFASAHILQPGRAILTAGGSSPFELGEPQQPGRSINVRQSFPLMLGTPSISRGNAC